MNTATTYYNRTIYGLDSSGKLKVKEFKASNDKFVTIYGRYGGKMTSSVKQCHNKNVGRANESLAQDQAIQMVQRGVTKDTGQNGYMEVPVSVVLEGENAIVDYLHSLVVDDTPMLAYPVDWERIDWDKGMMVSRKLDGIRCVAVYRNGKLTLQSRKQKPIETMPHIVAELEPVMRSLCISEGIGELRLDGELYNHEYKNDFENLVSAVKKYQPGVSEILQYHVYGLINFQLCAFDRYKLLMEMLGGLHTVRVVDQSYANSRDTAMNLHSRFTNDGYEGAMLLDPNSMYTQSRSYSLMKVKEMQTQEFVIVDVVPMDARPDLGLIVLKTKDGEEFKATPKCDEQKKAWYLQNRSQIIFRMGTVQYFSMTKAGVPRLPVFLAVRDYE